MSESSPATDRQSNPWVEFDLSPQDGHRSFWSILSWPFGWIPSTPERRLVFYLGATAQVRPAGRHLLPIAEALARPQAPRRRPAFRIGWVAMTPSVRELPVGPMWSRDGIEFTATFSFVLTPLDTPGAIARLACGGSEEEKRVINTLQRAAQSILVAMDAEMALASLTDVFTRIQQAVEENLRGVDLPFSVLEPRVESCHPTDPKVAMTSLERQRLRAEAQLETERSKQLIERAERDTLIRAAQLKSELTQKKAELERAELEAIAAIRRDQIKAEAAPAILRTNATAEADRDRIKAQATADIEKVIEERRVKIAELKAELANKPAGERALYTEQSFELEKEKMRVATKVLTELRGLEARGALFGGQYSAMKEFFEKTMNVQLREFAIPPMEPIPEPLASGPTINVDPQGKDTPTAAPPQGQQTTPEEKARNEEPPA